MVDSTARWSRKAVLLTAHLEKLLSEGRVLQSGEILHALAHVNGKVVIGLIDVTLGGVQRSLSEHFERSERSNKTDLKHG